MDALEEHEFKETVKKYIEVHDQIAEGQRMLTQLRKKRISLEALILQYMKVNEIDECSLVDGKLMRRTSKTVEGLKRDYLQDELAKVFGSADRAEEVVGHLWTNRNVSEREVLKRTKARNTGT